MRIPKPFSVTACPPTSDSAGFESIERRERRLEDNCKALLDNKPHVYEPSEKPTSLHDMLVAETEVPVRGLFVLVLAFGITIGPMNLFVLSRLKRRIWLWWNVPAISLLTCLLIFGYSLVSEGVTGHGKTASVTRSTNAIIPQRRWDPFVLLSPNTSEGPHFSVDTEATLLSHSSPNMGNVGDDGTHFTDWTADQFSIRLGTSQNSSLFPDSKE